MPDPVSPCPLVLVPLLPFKEEPAPEAVEDGYKHDVMSCRTGCVGVYGMRYVPAYRIASAWFVMRRKMDRWRL